MNTVQNGRCMLFNYTTAVEEGTTLSLHFRPSADDLEAFSTYFLDEDNIAPAAATDGTFGRLIVEDIK